MDRSLICHVEVGLPIQVDDDEVSGVPPSMNKPHIRPGISLLNTSVWDMLKNTYTPRACAVTVVNHTSWKLGSAGVFPKGGQLVTAQHDVEPWSVEVFVAEKYPGTATSTYGTASFSVQGLVGQPQYVNIMWSVPFRRNIDQITLGIEVSQRKGPEDFDRMYYHGNTQKHSVTRSFKYNLVPLRVETNDLVVIGSIGNGFKTEALINVHERY